MEKRFPFHTFCSPGHPLHPSGSFRQNIQAFLQECCTGQEIGIQGMPTWRTQLQLDEGTTVPLYTIEDKNVTSFCDHCRATGWSHHYVSRQRYYMIIPAEDAWNDILDQNYLQHVENHSLHGMFHVNGFGHLLSIKGNGAASLKSLGSQLSTEHLMNLWDRISLSLETREISVKDLSKKGTMDLRLLYGVSFGRSWYGRWGYMFSKGIYGVNSLHYDIAVKFLGSLELEQILYDFSTMSNQYEVLQQIIDSYSALSPKRLETVKDLIKFLLDHEETTIRSLRTVGNLRSSKEYKREKILLVVKEVVEVLKDRDFTTLGAMPRKDLREAVVLRGAIKRKGLLDHVFSQLYDVIVDNMIVRRTNTISGQNAYSLEVLSPSAARLGYDLHSDIAFVYDQVLISYPDTSDQAKLVKSSAKTLLHSTYFLKKCYPSSLTEDLSFICQLIPPWSENEYCLEIDSKKMLPKPPGEIVLVPCDATVGDLKKAVESVFRRSYYITRNVVVLELNAKSLKLEDDDLVSVIEEKEVGIRGTKIDCDTCFRHQGGSDSFKMVKCICGAEDEDGEMMLQCNICKVYMHRCCNAVEDVNTVVFLCQLCLGPSQKAF